jgi:hypothetical protein
METITIFESNEVFPAIELFAFEAGRGLGVPRRHAVAKLELMSAHADGDAFDPRTLTNVMVTYLDDKNHSTITPVDEFERKVLLKQKGGGAWWVTLRVKDQGTVDTFVDWFQKKFVPALDQRITQTKKRKLSTFSVVVKNLPENELFLKFFNTRSKAGSSEAPFYDLMFDKDLNVIGFRAPRPSVGFLALHLFLARQDVDAMSHLGLPQPPETAHSDRFGYHCIDPLGQGDIWWFSETVKLGQSTTHYFLYKNGFKKFIGFNAKGLYIGFDGTVAAAADRFESADILDTYKQQAYIFDAAFFEGWVSVTTSAASSPKRFYTATEPRAVSAAGEGYNTVDENAQWLTLMRSPPGPRPKYLPACTNEAMEACVYDQFCKAVHGSVEVHTTFNVATVSKAYGGKRVVSFSEKCQILDCMQWFMVRSGMIGA